MIKFTIPGPPIGKGRPRATTINGMARLYTPKKTASYEGLVAHAAHEAMAGRTPMEDAATVTMDVLCPIPQSWSQKKQRMAAQSGVTPVYKTPRVTGEILEGA
jgi:Holliday junction resolvase RusA-like endonuclease